MTSKLFHTVVGVGIALGAMSVGCAADPSTDSSSSEAADTTTSTNPTEPGTATGNDQDRYCTGAWPTTKRGGRPTTQQACIDPKNECGAYPGGGTFSYDFCLRADAENVCSDDEKTNVWKICKDTATGPQWECPSGTMTVDQCAAPADDTTTASNGAQN